MPSHPGAPPARHGGERFLSAASPSTSLTPFSYLRHRPPQRRPSDKITDGNPSENAVIRVPESRAEIHSRTNARRPAGAAHDRSPKADSPLSTIRRQRDMARICAAMQASQTSPRAARLLRDSRMKRGKHPLSRPCSVGRQRVQKPPGAAAPSPPAPSPAAAAPDPAIHSQPRPPPFTSGAGGTERKRRS